MARPRVFVSSTYYDLKYVRERIERFIKNYNMEPILFESDDVYFNPAEPVDTSCYNEVKNCQMMILIIGGRYGSSATTKEEYEKKYISVTQKEYTTARSKGIPVMIFVDSNVYSEYKTYQKNRNSIPESFKFAHVDDSRVFEFIGTVEQQAIKTFSRIEDIEHYFANQVSGMLYSYLIQLQTRKADNEIISAVDQIKHVSNSMQTMINSIAKKVLDGENGQYEELIRQQNRDLIDLFFDLFKQNVTWDHDIIDSAEEIPVIKKVFYDTIFNQDRINRIQEAELINTKWDMIL